jgi:hypothetical protein
MWEELQQDSISFEYGSVGAGFDENYEVMQQEVHKDSD